MATTKSQAVADPGVGALAVTTIVFDGIPMTQAIAEGYAANAKTPAQIAALTPAVLSDFKANMSYQTAVRIGVVNTGTVDLPVYEDRYELKTVYVYVWTGLLQGLIEFQNAVLAGNAFTVGTAPSTTVPATTTTTIP